MNDLLVIDNLSKSYNSLSGEVKAIENLSLSVRDGEFVSIVGPSGCGKSTLLNILAGLDSDFDGKFAFKDDVKVGYMLQDDSLFPWLSVYENAIIGLKIQDKCSEENILYVKGLLEKYGLSEFMDKKISSLSGGMKQRVALIRTLATKPDLVFLDEPFSALDYQTRLKVSDDIYRIIKNEEITVIMVSHDIAESISLSERIIVLTNRPARVKNIYDINLSNKSNPINNRKAPEFSYYYDMIWKDIDND